jgi:hypothetical protein
LLQLCEKLDAIGGSQLDLSDTEWHILQRAKDFAERQTDEGGFLGWRRDRQWLTQPEAQKDTWTQDNSDRIVFGNASILAMRGLPSSVSTSCRISNKPAYHEYNRNSHWCD